MANPIMMLLEGNGSLAGRDRAGAFTATGSGALRYAPANGARTNYYPDPLLVNSSRFAAQSGGTVTDLTAGGPNGENAVRINCGSSSTVGGAISNGASARCRVLGPGTYTVSMDLRYVSGDGRFRLGILEYTATGGGFLATGGTTDLNDTNTSWHRVSASLATTATGTHYLGVVIYNGVSASYNTTVEIANIVVESGTTAGTWFSPTVWLDPITGVLGTAHASPSVSRATFWIEEATTNTVPDPSFEAATITTNWAANGAATISKVTTHAYLGSNGGKVSCTASTSDGIDQLSTSGAAASNGQAWTVSGRIRAFAAGDVGKTVKAQIVERTSADAVVATNLGSAITLTDAWQSFSYTVTLAGGGTVAKATCGFRAGAATAVDFVLDCVQLEQKAYATSYCDGTLGTGYSWSGTANASSSSRTAARVCAAGANRINTTRGAYACRVYPTNGPSGTARIVQAGTYAGASGDAVVLAAATYNNVRMYFSTDTAGAGGSGAGAVNLSLNTFANPYGDWTVSTGQAGLLTGALQSGSRTVTPAGSLVAAAPNIDLMTDQGTSSNMMNGYAGPVAIYDRPLTAAERAKVNAAINSNGAASLWTVLGSNAYRNFQLRPVSQ